MSPWRFALICLLLVAVALVPACSNDEDEEGSITGPPTPEATIEDALDGYWPAQQGLGDELAVLDQVWDEAAAALNDGAEIGALVDEFLTHSAAAAAEFDTLIALEEAIVPYGASKGHFGEPARHTIRNVYSSARQAVVQSGQMLRTCWRVLSGAQSLRDALGADDAGVPVVSGTTERLRERLVQRDAAIVAAILGGETRGGLVPLDQLAGATPEQKAETYQALADDDPLKLQIRGAVHLWHDAELQATLAILETAACGQVRAFAGATVGSPVLAQATQHLDDGGEPAPVTVALRSAASGEPLAGEATLLVRKRDQAEGLARIAVLADVDPDLTLDLPAGAYDVVVIGADYIRGVAVDLPVAGGAPQTLAVELLARQGNEIVLESVDADPAVTGVDDAVLLTATAISTVGQSLHFAWETDGPAPATVWGRNEEVHFVTDEPGTYTVSLTVSDDLGNQAQHAIEIQVLAAAVDVVQVDLGQGTFADSYLNPGETLELTLTLATTVAEGRLPVVAELNGHGGAQALEGATAELSLAHDFDYGWPVTIALPADYSRETATFTATFTTETAVIERTITVPVRFYAELDRIPTPVTDRVLQVTGKVANPALATAHLVLNDDIDQVWELHLTDGRFAQTILLEGSEESQNVKVELVADSGAWRATDSATFTATIQPSVFRVTLTWDTPDTDVDLWVTDPSGEKCYYANPSTASGLELDVDDVTGWGPENITNLAPPPGDYLVQLHYFSDHDDSQAIGSNCQVTIRLFEGTENEQVRSYTGFLADTGDIWTVATVTIDTPALAGFATGGGRSHLAPASLPTKP